MADDPKAPESQAQPPPPEAGQHPVFTGGPVALISGANPRFPSRLGGGQEGLKQALARRGHQFEETQGRYGAPEPSLIVHGIPEAEAADLANVFGQESVVTGQGGAWKFLYTNGERRGHYHPSTGIQWFPGAPADNWTKLPGGGYFRVDFDWDRLHPWGLQKAEAGQIHGYVHCYPWHDGHTSHHAARVLKAELPPSPERQTPGGLLARLSLPWGRPESGPVQLDHYPLTAQHHEGVERLAEDHGYRIRLHGGHHGRPDFGSMNYDSGWLGVEDPADPLGGRHEVQEAWRVSHELAHALTLPEVNRIYGEGRRRGSLGSGLSVREAQRALHWEFLAASKQRDLLEQLGVRIPDEDFHRERNGLMLDGLHRVLAGTEADLGAQHFRPHGHEVPLQVAMQAVAQEAQRRQQPLTWDNRR